MTHTRPAILAIDDNPQNLVVLATALDGEFDFELAASGEQGLVLAEDNPPDLILLDVMMPAVDGFETCRRLKENPRLAGIPIIFLTALSDLENEVRGLELGGVDYITKPLNVELVRQRMRNILGLTRLTQELKRSEEQLRLVMEATGEGIWDWDIASGIVAHNAAWCRILGLDGTFLSHPLDVFQERIHPDDQLRVQQTIETCLREGSTYSSEHRLRTASDRHVWVLDRGRVVERSADGKPVRMLGSIRDIDDRKRQEAEIFHLAYFDPLTDLPNRRLLLDRLLQSLLLSKRSGGLGALMFIDMDKFKQLNDTHGHAMGDALLVEVAERLRRCVRAQDTVARFGGDEFVVLLENLDQEAGDAMNKALTVGEKIRASLARPYILGDLHYPSSPSVGVTLTNGSDTLDDILHRADVAMYEAKNAGRNSVRSFIEAR